MTKLTHPNVADTLNNTRYGLLYRHVWISPRCWKVLQRGNAIYENIDLCLIDGQRHADQYSLSPHSDNFAFLSVESFCPCSIRIADVATHCSCEGGNELLSYKHPFAGRDDVMGNHFEYRTLSGKQRMSVDGVTIERSDNVHDHDKFEFCAVDDQVLFYRTRNPELYDAYKYYALNHM